MPRAADRAKAATLGEMATRAQYEVLRAGREKVQRSAPLWRRVTDSKPCGFCAMVASRGPVYGSASKAGQGNKYHSRCGCTVEPFYGDPSEWVPSPDEARFIEAYRAAYRTGVSTEELSDRIGALLARPYEAPQAATRTAFDPKWREGRDVHVRKLENPTGRQALADDWRGTVNRYEREREQFAANIEERTRFILAEGLSKRQVTAIMKKQPDVQRWRTAIDEIDEQLATARRQLDDIERDLANVNLPDFDPENPLKFYGDRYTFHDESDVSIRWAKDWETFDEDLHVLMRDHFAEVDDSGVFVGGARNLTDVDDLQRLKTAKPRGHDADRTYDDIGGVYAPSQRVCGCSHKAWFSDTHSTALHEGSHVIDDALGRVSNSSEWKAAHEAIPMRDWLNPYYRSTGNPTGYLSESWAESLAAYQRGRNDGLDGDDLAEFVGRAVGVNPQNTISGENAAILTGRPLVEAVATLLKRVGR